MDKSCRALQAMEKTLAFTFCEMEAREGTEQKRNVFTVTLAACEEQTVGSRETTEKAAMMI